MTASSLPPGLFASDIAGYEAAWQWLSQGPKPLLIDGKWQTSASRKTFDTFDPATEQRLASVAEAEAADVDAAVIAARRAFENPSWSSLSGHARTRALLKIADAVEQHRDELAVLETLDVGMPLWHSRAMLSSVIDVLYYYAGWPTKITGTTLPTDPSIFSYTLREPLGVCALIVPWNMPLLIAANKIINALACGNTVVLKPAELAPLSCLRLVELIHGTGLPAGVVNIVPGFGPTAGASLASHPDVDKVSFTGSTVVGKQILQASTGTLKKVTLELGGKSPNIIFEDANLDLALQAAAKTFCSNAGQTCSAGTRLFVHKSLYPEVSERVTQLAASFPVGSPFDPQTKLGPLISAKQMGRVMDYIDAGINAGAALMLGGIRQGKVGHFVAPTVFGGVSNDMKIAREEIFGPVLSVIPFEDENDAVFKGNTTAYGLAAAVWTRDIARAHRVARAIKAGRLWINTYGDFEPVAPAGGYKQSGLGREFGQESIDEYTQIKAVLLRY